MYSTEDNLHHLGSQVEEPTQEELKSAFSTLKGVL
jgi:hypothetical protein